MTQQPNVSRQSLDRDQTVQTRIVEGKWMLLQEAAESTGLSEKTLRRYTKRKQVKWRRLGKQTNSPIQIWVNSDLKELADKDPLSLDGVSDVFDAEAEDVELETSESEIESAVQGDQQPVMTDVIRTIANEFANKLDQQRELIYELRHDLHEKDVQLRLLPDLQKQLEEKEKLVAFETSSLQKQVSALASQNEALMLESTELKSKLEAIEKKGSWWKKFFLPRDV
jgi:hypothetical protein